MAAASSCREEAERDPARRDLWLQQASKWMALAAEQAGHALIVCDHLSVAKQDTRH
ncbi:hypothetical protein [Bradyrhizobium sp. STM 3809]|uniref:hypothetical protein n=1 Tax=Bradyrhizobium sp. STM 3809 TaxID=551936 RepID=UPI00024091A6|nr:hypothetical protein [Bradyrhizobium sp. STM 3809]CCD98497.1 conserved hypothetical protein [Bradyrhizobium sp. STM 3809]